MKKKILSVLLTFAMILSMTAMLASPVSAADPIYEINNYTDLETFIASLATHDYAGETVELKANIKVNDGWTANDGTDAAVTAPAVQLDTAAATKAFAGTFNGNDFTISGLYMTGAGFLPTVAGATIQNVTFDNCTSTSSAYASNANCAGIVAGRFYDGDGNLVLEKVTVKNSKLVNGTTNGNIGMLVGCLEKTSGSVSFTDCQSIACNLYSGAKTSLVGGIMGVLYAAGKGATILRCYADTDIVIAGASNNGYKAGGIIGYNGSIASITDCENVGDISSQTYAAGIIGDDSGKVTVTNCVNRGDMIAVAISSGVSGAGGIVGRFNNAFGSSIIGCANYGEISAATTGTGTDVNAGGIIACCQNKTDYEPITVSQTMNNGAVSSAFRAGGLLGYLAYGELNVTDFANMADIEAGSNAGGLIGETNKDGTAKNSDGVLNQLIWLSVTNYVNTGDITATKKAGGLVGLFQGKQGKIDKAITVGTVIGYNGTDKINIGASCAMFGSWTQKNGTNELEVIDFFYSNNGIDNVFGLWANLESEYDNHKASYTATGKSLDFVPGTTNTDSSLSSYENTQGKNLSAYNKFFVENGYFADASDLYGEKGANILKAFNLGVDWMLTSTVPVPASVFAMLEEKKLAEADVDYVGYQENAGSTLTSIRVIAGLDAIEYENTGFELYLVKVGQDALMLDKNTTTVYTSLNVYDESGNALAPYLATEAGYSYLSAITVSFTAEQLATTTTLIAKPYVTVDGQKIYGDACAIVIENTNGVLSIADQYVM